MSIRRSLALVLCSTLAVASAKGQHADLVVRNASVWTGESSQAQVQAFAVRDGVIVRVGANDDIDDLVGPKTEIVDAEGRRVLPGIIDTHVHIENGALGFAQLDVRPATSRDELLALVQHHAAGLDEDEWVLGRGWSAESWPDPTPPTPDELDQAAGGRPVILVRMDGHSLIAGAEAIRRAGVSNDGPSDPPGGKIGRTDSGAPTGAFYEQAMGIVMVNAPEVSDARIRDLTRRAIQHLNSQGITQVGAIETKRFVETQLRPLDAEGELTVRVGVSITGGGDELDSWRPILAWAAATRTISDRLTVLGFKGYMDGSLGSRTAWMLEPFQDDPHDHDNAGFPLAMAENGDLRKLIQLAAELELQPAVHAIGDKANRTVLNWYQFLGPSAWSLRPRVEHAQHLDPADIPLFARLSVIPSMQPYHKADDGRYAEERLGTERIQTSYAFRSLIDSGALLAFGSDWPVVSCNPFLGVHAAVTAQTTNGGTFVPEQSLSVEESLTCYTVNGARALHTPGKTGRIQPDHFADFIIIDRDVLSIDPNDINDVRVLQTWVGGVKVFDADGTDDE